MLARNSPQAEETDTEVSSKDVTARKRVTLEAVSECDIALGEV